MSFNEWKLTNIYDVVNIIGGGTPKTTVDEYWNGKINWLSVKDFNSGARWVYDTEKTITELGLEKSSTKILKKGYLIISARGTVGELAQLGKDMAFNQSCYGLNGRNEIINDFLYYLLKYKLNHIKKSTHGSVFNTITKDTFKLLDIKLPPLEEQKAIAKILSDLDEKIETNNKINKTLEEMAGAIFKEWFVDFEFPNEEGKPYKSSGGEMVESELGMIPKGWTAISIGELPLKITDYVANGSFKALKDNVKIYDTNNYAIMLRNTDLKADLKTECKFVDKKSYEFLSKSKLVGGEIIISNVGDVGSVYMTPALKIPMTLGSNLIMIDTLENENINYNIYVFELFKSYIGQHYIKSITGGSAQPKFNKTDFKKIRTILASNRILNLYTNTCEKIIKGINAKNEENRNLEKLRDTLLPKLMSGEIRVPLDNIEV